MGFASAFQGAYGMVDRSRRHARDAKYEEELRGRQRTQWGREDAARAELDQLGYDQQYGVAQPGTDNSYDIAEAKRFGVQAPESTLKRTPLKKSEVHGRLGKVALGLGDTKSYLQSQQMQSAAEEDEILAAALKADPDPQVARYLNQTHRSISVGEPDKYGFRPMSVVKPDGSASFAQLSMADQKKLSAAGALMERNPTRAMQMIAEVNKDLAAAMDVENRTTLGMVKEENDATARRLTTDHQREQLAQTGRYQEGMLGIGRLNAQANMTNARANAGRAAAGSAAMAKLEAGERLGREAAGYAQGISAARSAGAKDAEGIYEQHLLGANARLQGMGLRPVDPRMKPEVDPRAYLQSVGSLMGGGMDLAQARMLADSVYGIEDGGADSAMVQELLKIQTAKRAGLNGGNPRGSAPNDYYVMPLDQLKNIADVSPTARMVYDARIQSGRAAAGTVK